MGQGRGAGVMLGVLQACSDPAFSALGHQISSPERHCGLWQQLEALFWSRSHLYGFCGFIPLP